MTRVTAAATMCALCLLACNNKDATGPKGDGGLKGETVPQGERGPTGSPDTAADILAKLSTVSVNANTLGGVTPSGFARAGQRSVNINVAGLSLKDGANINFPGLAEVILPSAEQPGFGWSFVIPVDAVPGGSIQVVVNATALSANTYPCDYNLTQNVFVLARVGLALDGTGTIRPAAGLNATIPASNILAGQTFEVTPSAGMAFAPGDTLVLSLQRDNTNAQNCNVPVRIVGLQMIYVAQ